ncbi:MAG: hypothetical protein LBP37_06260 [Spirochaetaceae bacterium]|nr:hypothetical protein [Spirochaetaceae bacterium]
MRNLLTKTNLTVQALCLVLSGGCDLWNQPLTRMTDGYLDSVESIRIEPYPYPNVFYRGEAGPQDSASWEKYCGFKVIGTKVKKETLVIPPEKYTVSGFSSVEPTREPQLIKVSYYDDYNGEVSAEFRIVILDAGGRFYRISVPENSGKNTGVLLVPFPSRAVPGQKIEVFTSTEDAYIIENIYYSAIAASGEDEPVKINKENGLFVFTMPACDIELKAQFKDTSGYEAMRIHGQGGAKYYQTLAEAFSSAENTDSVIVLKKEILLNEGITISGKDIKLSSYDGAAGIIKRGAGTGSLFTVESGGKLTLESSDSHGLTIDGGAKNQPPLTAYAALLTVAGGGALTIGANKGGAGVTLQNNVNGNDVQNGGGVFVQSGGAFTMNGGLIRDNQTSALSGQQGKGGGVFVCNGGSFTMNDGKISGNRAIYGGGGVYVKGYQGIFTFIGGKISENGKTSGNLETNFGGGVLADGGGNIVMSGGEISGNTAKNIGGGVFVDVSSAFTMNGGFIGGNNAPSGGAAKIEGSFSMSGHALVKPDNDLYLGNVKTITVSGTLNPPPPYTHSATIVPGTYSANTQILSGSYGASYNRFAVKPQGGSSYKVNAQGCIEQM